jgi:hypothetical protein
VLRRNYEYVPHLPGEQLSSNMAAETDKELPNHRSVADLPIHDGNPHRVRYSGIKL